VPLLDEKSKSPNKGHPAQFGIWDVDDSPTRALGKIWLRWSAHRVKPAADVYLGMSLTAVMPGSGRAGDFRIPPVHREVSDSTANYEPVVGTSGNESANFAPEFLQCCHALVP